MKVFLSISQVAQERGMFSGRIGLAGGWDARVPQEPTQSEKTASWVPAEEGGGNLGWWASILKEGREGTSGREEGGVPCDSEPGHTLGFPPSKAPWAVTPQTLLTEGSSPAQGSPSCLSFQLLPQNPQPMSSGSFLSLSHLPSKSLLAPNSSTPPHIAEILGTNSQHTKG